MMNMTNILLRMQREIHKLKRRTSRMEQSVVKQTKMVQPVIRIPRLTKGFYPKRSTFSHHKFLFR